MKSICESFEDPLPPATPIGVEWTPIERAAVPLPLVFSVDGSYQVIERGSLSRRAVGFVKTAVLRLDRTALAKINP